jgi:hypothetical protein
MFSLLSSRSLEIIGYLHGWRHLHRNLAGTCAVGDPARSSTLRHGRLHYCMVFAALHFNLPIWIAIPLSLPPGLHFYIYLWTMHFYIYLACLLTIDCTIHARPPFDFNRMCARRWSKSCSESTYCRNPRDATTTVWRIRSANNRKFIKCLLPSSMKLKVKSHSL